MIAAPAAGAGARVGLDPERVLRALDQVTDPELDEPITELGFVTGCTVGPEGDVEVRLRLPTPQCAPNFAFLMAADARRAVQRLAGVRRARVRLEDHYTEREINGALDKGLGFAGAFPGEVWDDGLAGLRELFERKALAARQARLCQSLLDDGRQAAEVVALRAAQLPPQHPDSRRCLQLRARLGLPHGPGSPAFVRPDGAGLEAPELARWLRIGRLMATSLEANGGLCRSLLAFRHAQPISVPEEVQPT